MVVLTHDPKLDVPALLAAFASGAGYVGALGSRRTTADRERRLREAGASDADLVRLHAPCGLDIGSATPDEVALSILAEIVAHRSGRAGNPLRGGLGADPRAARRGSGVVTGAPPEGPPSVERLTALLAEQSYVADLGIATVTHLALKLGRPILLEGDPGVGKTELAKALASALDARLIRLQCYEGIDVAHAVYDWSYTRQMLEIRAHEARDAADGAVVADLFSREFLVRRPLLDAIDNDDAHPPVLLVDEIDRADDEFEAFLLELLSDFQITIPELGTIHARQRPIVVLTSNRTRELHDALRRRCLYHWIEHPSVQREIEIIRIRVPRGVGAPRRPGGALRGGRSGAGPLQAPGGWPRPSTG